MMALKSFTAYQPECDIAGCEYVILWEVEAWFKDSDYAKQAWSDEGNWTDGKTWVCDNHRHEPHMWVGDDEKDACARCEVEIDEHVILVG